MKPYKAYILTLLVNLLPLFIISLIERNATGDGKMGIVIYCLFYIISAILNISFFFANANRVMVKRFVSYYLSSIFFFITSTSYLIYDIDTSIDNRINIIANHLGIDVLLFCPYLISNLIIGVYYQTRAKAQKNEK